MRQKTHQKFPWIVTGFVLISPAHRKAMTGCLRAVCGLMPLAPQAFEYLPLARHHLQNPFTAIESFKAIVFSRFYR